MPKNNVTKFYECFNLPNAGLRTYFGNVVAGNSDDYTTPFAKGTSTSQLLEEWEKQLVSISDRWPTLYEFEEDLKSKVGPLSIMKPLSERMEDIEAYYTGVSEDTIPLSESAIRAVRSEWNISRGLRIRSQKRTVDVMKKSTNSGSPYFTKRRRIVDKTIPCSVRHTDLDVTQVLDGKLYHACAVLGWRGQEGGIDDDDVKQRVVWMFPFAVNIEELRVYQPLIETAQSFSLVPAWQSMEAVDLTITGLFDTKPDEDLIVCTDFTKFDQHFNRSLQDAAKTIISDLFRGDPDLAYWLSEVYPIKYMIPLAYDYGKLKFGNHGMGSGSGGTNADETLAHRCLQYEAALTQNQQLNRFSQCLGDDGVLSYPGITVEDVVQSYTKHGLEMNDSKQYASTTDCTYLRRWHSKDYRMKNKYRDNVCVGVYSTFRALGRLRYQERYYDPEVWNERMVALRQLSILENVKYHPMREQFVDFCMERDKFRLGIDIPGFLDNIGAEAKKAIDFMPDFLGYTKSMQADADKGISKWWIVNYLKSK